MKQRVWMMAAVAAFGAFVLGLQRKPDGYTDTPKHPDGKWHVHDPARPQPPIVTPGKQFSQQADAPSDAVVLFDGKDLSRWEHGNGQPGKWKVENGYMEVVPKSGILRTKDEFGDFQLHLEWATPAKVESQGQGRGNNGVNIFGRYEIQILDSFENQTYADGGAASIYGQYPPMVNASRPPGQWQTYDIMFEGPRWDEGGKLLKKARVTVLHNGLVVHHGTDLHGATMHRNYGKYDKPHPPHGRIELYEHGNPVRFRNIWIRPLKGYDQGGNQAAAQGATQGDAPGTAVPASSK